MVLAPAAKRLGRFLGVRPGEGARTGLLFVTILLVIAAYTTTKAVRDATFLTRSSIASLSWLMMAVAAAAAVGVALFDRFAAGRPRDKLILATNLFVAATVEAICVALHVFTKAAWIAWVLYLWSAVFGLFLVAEFWLLANDLLHARQARRLYGVIGAGAILGGVVGGVASAWGAKLIGTSNLLHVVSVELVLAALVARRAWRHRRLDTAAPAVESPSGSQLSEGLAVVRRTPLVRALALMMVCLTLCYTVGQWQWKGIVKAHLHSPDEMTAFFGWFSAVLNVFSLMAQLLVTTRLLRRFGAPIGLAMLPTSYLVGALSILVAMVFGRGELIAAGAAAMLTDGFRFSVDKAATELLYQPLPRGIKSRAKPFIDTVVDRFAGGFAGLLWIGLVKLGHIDQPTRLWVPSLVIVAVVALWAATLWRARRVYLDQLAGATGARRAAVDDPRAARALEEALTSDHPRVRSVAAELSREPPPRAPLDEMALERALTQLERHAQAHRWVARPALSSTAAAQVMTMPLLERALGEALARDLARLGDLVAPSLGEEVRRALRKLARPQTARRAAALELLDHLLAPEHRGLVERLEELLLDEAPDWRPPRRALLEALLDDPDPWLRAVAVHAAAGEPGLRPLLKRRTQDDARCVREAAWRSLVHLEQEARQTQC